MADIKERYGIVPASAEWSYAQATERTDRNVALAVYSGGDKATVVVLTPEEARRFASMLLVLAHRADGGEE